MASSRPESSVLVVVAKRRTCGGGVAVGGAAPVVQLDSRRALPIKAETKTNVQRRIEVSLS
jgi:hypothetical protein